MPARVTLRLSALTSLLCAGSRHAWFVENEVIGLADLVGPGAVVFDVGAEYGLYTWSLARLVGPTGAVHAVEPQPELARHLRRTGAALGARTVTLHEFALSAHSGEGHLSRPSRRYWPVHGRTFLSDDTTGLSSNDEFHHHTSIDVGVETLDDLVNRLGVTRLDFVKADVEGGEARLLAGAKATLERFHPTLLLELEDRHLARFDTSVAQVVDVLADLGYRPSHWEGGSWHPGIVGRDVLFRRPI